MRKFKKLTMTFALLIMAVGGAWAQSTFGVKEITADMLPASWSTDESSVTADDLAKLGFMEVTEDEAKTWTGAPQQVNVRLIYTPCKSVNWVKGEGGYVTDSYTRKIFYSCLDGQKIFITTEITEWDLTPDADKKVWTLDKMPASNIELQVEYFAESNLFLSKEALADKTSIAVKAGKDDVEFGEDGKSANPVTEGTPMTVTFNGTKKVLGMKVEKVAAPAPTTTVTWNSSDFYFDPNPYTKDGVTLTPSNEMAANGNNLYQFGDNTFTTTLGKFTKIEIEFESTTYNFDGWTKGTGEQYQPDPQTYPDWWENLLKLTWTGDAESVTIKGKDVFGIHSITFTIQ